MLAAALPVSLVVMALSYIPRFWLPSVRIDSEGIDGSVAATRRRLSGPWTNVRSVSIRRWAAVRAVKIAFPGSDRRPPTLYLTEAGVRSLLAEVERYEILVQAKPETS